MIRTWWLVAARFCSAAWVGAAALFVVDGIRLVTSPAFDSTAKDSMALLRFPPYYLFGFMLVGIALLATVGAGGQLRARRRWFALALLAAALAVMAYDWFQVYQPLAAMISTPGAPRSHEFMQLHRWSEVVNTVHVGLVFFAAILLCRPSGQKGSDVY